MMAREDNSDLEISHISSEKMGILVKSKEQTDHFTYVKSTIRKNTTPF